MEEMKNLKGSKRQEAKIAAGEIVVSEILKYLDNAKTPVSGGSYVSKKKDGEKADLLEKGDLWSSVTFETYRDGVDYGVFDSDEAPKAMGHQTGYKGHPNIPNGKYIRQFVAEKDQSLKRDILTKIRSAIKEIEDA